MSNSILRAIDFRLKQLAGHPPLYSCSLFNFIGLQVLRIPWLRFTSNLRHRAYQSFNQQEYGTMRENGFLRISGFLEEERATEIRDAFEELTSKEQGELARSGVLLNVNHQVTRVLIDDNCIEKYKEARLIHETFLGSDRLYELASDMVGYRLKCNPRVRLEAFRVPEGEVDIYDHNQAWHKDRIQDCVKILYFIDDTGLNEGCFEYVEGSHRISGRSFVFEVIASMRLSYYYIASFFRRGRAYDRAGKTRVDFTERFMDFGSRPIDPKANTLTCSNQAGYHRRGKVKGGHMRKIVWIEFYDEYPGFFWRGCHRFFRKLFMN